MYTRTMTSPDVSHPRHSDLKLDARAATDDVMEFPLLLSRQQVARLADAAERQGMTSAQFLRRCINSLCLGGES
jgi:hypothetical protein